VLLRVPQPRPRGGATGPGHRRRPAPAVQRLLRGPAGPHLQQLRGAAPREGVMASGSAAGTPMADASAGVAPMAAPVVDVHAHLVPKGWPELSRVCGGSGWPWLRLDSERSAMLMLGDVEFGLVGPQAWDPATSSAEMDAARVDRQVGSPTPVCLAYGGPGQQAVRAARIFNDLTLEHTAAGGGRLIPFCQVQLRDPDAACEELDRCLAVGHAGVEIGNHVGDREDRKSTRLNSSHVKISYAVFCLKKKKKDRKGLQTVTQVQS